MKTALVAIAKNEDNYLKEWIDYNIQLGFTDIFVFQNNWRYIKNDIKYENVHLIELDGHRMQNKCYNDFINNNYEKYDFITCLDCDEFLFLRDNKSISEFLSEYTIHPVIYIPWRLFGDNGLDFVENEEYSCLKRFTKCDDQLHNLGKVIINTQITKNTVLYHNPHIVIINSTNVKLPIYIFPNKSEIIFPWAIPYKEMKKYSTQPAELWHFRNKTYQECYDRKYNQDDAFHEASECDFHTDIDAFNKTFEDHNKNKILVKTIL